MLVEALSIHMLLCPSVPPPRPSPRRCPRPQRDESKIYGCVCDSAWEVGYGSGQYQATQWFGADCSQKRCPSADDPRTASVDESDCEWCVACCRRRAR